MGELLASVGAEAAIGLGSAGAGYAGLQAFRALKRSEQVRKLAGVLKKAERVDEKVSWEAVSESVETLGFRAPAGTRIIPKDMPKRWNILPTDGKGGVYYLDHKNPGNAVRVMPGNPKSPYAASREPYVRWQKNGQALDANGNVVAKKSPEAHIPLENFKFIPEIFE